MSKTIKVRKGEGPWQVARRAGISLDELYRLNPKAKKMIHPDQELVVNDGTTTTVTVKKGEGPWQVAQKNGVSLEDVYKYNPKARKMIYPGDKLTIPIKQGTKKDTDSNQETKSSDTSTNKVANDSINNNANKTSSSPVKGNTQSAPKDTTKTQVAPKDTVTTNNTNTKSTTKQPSFDERMGRDNYYVNKYYRDNTPSKTKPKKDLETTVRQWNARKKNPNRSYRSAYDSYAPAVGPRKVQQTRRLDAIYDLGAAIDIDPTFLSGKGTPYTAPPVVSKKNPSREENRLQKQAKLKVDDRIGRLASFNNPMGPLIGLTEEGLLGVYAPFWGIGKGLDALGLNFTGSPVPSWNETVRQLPTTYLMNLEDTFNEGFGLPIRRRNGGPLFRRRLESAGVLSI